MNEKEGRSGRGGRASLPVSSLSGSSNDPGRSEPGPAVWLGPIPRAKARRCRSLDRWDGVAERDRVYQIGLIAHLPDPPLPGFDADKVHGSAKAYALFAVPDAAIGLTSYAVTSDVGGHGRSGSGNDPAVDTAAVGR